MPTKTQQKPNKKSTTTCTNTCTCTPWQSQMEVLPRTKEKIRTIRVIRCQKTQQEISHEWHELARIQNQKKVKIRVIRGYNTKQDNNNGPHP